MENKYRKAVFIVTYSKTKKGTVYLILKRKLHWRGWEFPKGGIKFFETKKMAVKRELFEETGLKPLRGEVKKFNFSGRYNYNKVLSDRPRFKGQTFLLYAVEVKKARVKVDNYEHESYRWVAFDEALRLLEWPNQKKSLKMVNDWLEKWRRTN